MTRMKVSSGGQGLSCEQGKPCTLLREATGSSWRRKWGRERIMFGFVRIEGLGMARGCREEERRVQKEKDGQAQVHRKVKLSPDRLGHGGRDVFVPYQKGGRLRWLGKLLGLVCSREAFLTKTRGRGGDGGT